MSVTLSTARLEVEFETVQHVVDALSDIESFCLANGDLRGAFATAYLHITRAIARAQQEGAFADPEWVEQYLVCFGNLYRRAVLACEAGRMDVVPKCWRLAFEAAREQTGFVIQHLTLGINAHINHDLPLALVEVGIDSARESKYADHTLVNTVLAEATEGMKRAVADSYAPILVRLDRLSGRYGEDLPNFSIPKAREHAWTMAVALAGARSELERRLIVDSIDEQAAVLARLILASPLRHPVVVDGVSMAKKADGLLTRLTRLPVLRRLFRQ
jgi:hypothetical protein